MRQSVEDMLSQVSSQVTLPSEKILLQITTFLA